MSATERQQGNCVSPCRQLAGYINTNSPADPAGRACLIAFFLGSLVCALSGCGSDRPTLTFATGNPSGIYYPYGGGLSSIWSQTLPGVNVKAEVTGASVINVIQVARGESEVGIAMGDVVVSAYRGEDRFPEPLPLRTLFAAYPNFVHLVAMADADIHHFSDLRGKRVSMGAPGSGTALAAENLLAGLGVGESELNAQYLNFSGTADGLKDGVLDAAFVVGGLGIGVVKELALTRDIVLVSFSTEEVRRLGERYPAYVPADIPQGTYRGVEEKVSTLSIWNLVVVNAAMEDELAYRLVCSLYQNQADLESIVAAASFTTPGNARVMSAVPLHPGAQRFLDALDASDSKILADAPGKDNPTNWDCS